MLYEMRTYNLKHGTVGEAEKRFGETVPYRTKYSPLLGLWHTDIGPLNQLIHIWPYENLEQRTKVRQEAVKSGHWPPDLHEFVEEQWSDIYNPAPFWKVPAPGKYGPVYEFRCYTLHPGKMPTMLERYAPKVEARARLSPLVVCMYSEHGALNRFLHVWAYKSMDERAKVREEASKAGIWPPDIRGLIFKQEVKILIPASCSPLQ